MGKTFTIKLAWSVAEVSFPDPVDEKYQVIKVTDSLDYHPGQFLNKDEVDDLCRSRAWKVTIVRPS